MQKREERIKGENKQKESRKHKQGKNKLRTQVKQRKKFIFLFANYSIFFLYTVKKLNSSIILIVLICDELSLVSSLKTPSWSLLKLMN